RNRFACGGASDVSGMNLENSRHPRRVRARFVLAVITANPRETLARGLELPHIDRRVARHDSLRGSDARCSRGGRPAPAAENPRSGSVGDAAAEAAEAAADFGT